MCVRVCIFRVTCVHCSRDDAIQCTPHCPQSKTTKTASLVCIYLPGCVISQSAE